mmetsp:Transcript_102500/g.221241  ORF Transcript_102500/g.221241 Transcript_102500/m.221241 type:complete len:357 (-) Transcript_102500:953-2023(-)
MGREARKGAERGHQGGDESNEKCGQAERDAEHGDHVPEVHLPHPRVADHPREAVAHHEQEEVQHREEDVLAAHERLVPLLTSGRSRPRRHLLLLAFAHDFSLDLLLVLEDHELHGDQDEDGDDEVGRHDADVRDVRVEVQRQVDPEDADDEDPDEDTKLEGVGGGLVHAHAQVDQEVEVRLHQGRLGGRVQAGVVRDVFEPVVLEVFVAQHDEGVAREVGHHPGNHGLRPEGQALLGRLLRHVFQEDGRGAHHRVDQAEVEDHREEEDGTQVHRHPPVLLGVCGHVHPAGVRREDVFRIVPELELGHDPDGEEGHGAVEEHLREVAEPHLLNGPLGGHGHQVQPLVAAHDEALDVA